VLRATASAARRQLGSAAAPTPTWRRLVVQPADATAFAAANRCFSTTGVRAQAAAQAAAPSVSFAAPQPAPSHLDEPQLDDLIITPSAQRRLSALRARAAAAAEAAAAAATSAGPSASASSSNIATAPPPPDPRTQHLRLRVDGGGCSGFKVTFALEYGPPAEDDRVFARGGAVVHVDTVSLDLVRGSTLDWVDEMMKNSFALVNNPHSASSCGCGSSFAAK